MASRSEIKGGGRERKRERDGGREERRDRKRLTIRRHLQGGMRLGNLVEINKC